MRRVLVPLDGSELAAAIVPDARRLAGPDGELILIRDVATPTARRERTREEQRAAAEEVQAYLDHTADTLRADGVTVRRHPLSMGDAAVAIDQGAEAYGADMIALATHGRSPAERLRYGGIAWRALMRSTVPVLLRHVEGSRVSGAEPESRRIMVPLDGSALAEHALPLARALAGEWRAYLHLVHVAPDPSAGESLASVAEEDGEQVRNYLQRVADRLDRAVEAQVLIGDVVETLVGAVEQSCVTDIVMTTHGRTGLTRVIVGSVADELIHRLHCPVIVIPVLAALRVA